MEDKNIHRLESIKVFFMNKSKFCNNALLFLPIIPSLLVAQAIAAVPGDVDGNNKIDLVEAIYALRVTGQSTGNSFTPDNLVGKTFFDIQEDSTGGETCIIETKVLETEIQAKEWLYINDNQWIPGCQEEYVPNESGSFPYEIVGGVLNLDLGEEIWPTQLVETFEECYLTSNPDGTATWYFTKDKVNAQLDPPAKFSQELLSANPWYPVEVAPQAPDDPDCNGEWTFDGNITMTVNFVDEGVLGVGTGNYLIHEGNFSSYHDGKYETDTIQSFSGATLNEATQITAFKSVLRTDGTTSGTGTHRIYFKNKTDAITYLNGKGKPSCYPTD